VTSSSTRLTTQLASSPRRRRQHRRRWWARAFESHRGSDLWNRWPQAGRQHHFGQCGGWAV